MSTITPAPGDEPLLTLDTFISRPTIKIDGKRYDILSPSELSIIESHRFAVAGRKIDALSRQSGKKAEDALDAVIADVARRVTAGVPDEVFGRLTGSARWAIVDVFTALLLGNRLGIAGAMTEAMLGVTTAMAQAASPTGASASPGSNDTTAATSGSGFGSFLRRLSGRC